MSGLGYIVGETGVYRVPLGFSCIYGSSDEGGEDGDRKKGREWKLPALCMQMPFFCMVNRRRTWGSWWDVLLRSVGEKV